jgi:hypothetical protein
MTSGLAKTLAATSLSLALATAGAGLVTFSTADVAFAKSDKANSGNRGGNSGANRGGGASEAGSDNRASRGNGGASGEARGNGAERSAAQGGNGNTARGGNSGGGNGKLFGFLPAHRSDTAGSGKPEVGRTERAARSAPQASARPEPRSMSAEDEEIAGNSWKTRLDDGVLETHPSELGMWNSARRNPRAIENMVAKYAETGDMSGAGGMIGYLVWSHQQAAESSTAYYDALQAAITDGDLSVETAERLLDGSLSQDSFDMALDELGEDVVVEDGVISCAAEAVCDAEELAALQEDADALAFLASDEAADLRTAQEDYDAAREDVEAADALVQPNKSTDEEVREQMLADVKDLLDIDEITAPAFVAPDIEEEDTGDSDEDA